MNVSTPVLVFAHTHDAYAHTPLAIARTLGRLGVDVASVHAHPDPPTAQSRFLHRSIVWSPWPADDDARLERLAATARTFRRRPILIPYDDDSALFVDEHAEALRPSFLFPERPAGLARSLVDKRRLHAICVAHGVPAPTTVAADEGEFEALLDAVAFPIVLKGAHSWIPGLDRRTRIVVARDREAALSAYRSMGASERRNVMLQEYIPGGPDSVWMFNGYFDERSECLVGFTGQKLRQSPPYTGPTSLGVCVPNERVAATTKHLMKQLGYRGILDLGFRYDARDGEYKLLDVNPRVGATFRLFVDPASQLDVVRALYLDLTGQPVPASAHPNGRKWIVEPWDTKSSLRYRRDGNLTAARWARSLRGIEEGAWFARDDPRPFLALCRRLVENRVRRSLP